MLMSMSVMKPCEGITWTMKALVRVPSNWREPSSKKIAPKTFKMRWSLPLDMRWKLERESHGINAESSQDPNCQPVEALKQPSACGALFVANRHVMRVIPQTTTDIE